MDFNELAKMFTTHYYQTFDTNRAGLASLYNETSMLTFEGEQFQGQPAIMQKLSNLAFQQVQHAVTTLDAQPVPNGAVVFVTGKLSVDGNPNPIQFSQVFQLHQGAPGQFVCVNDIFRLNYC
eukprot:GFYU01000220.1.p2 GENE.GFYU01000220.1~~GFYU01000220.1.p2  ORF type:complete len:130 (+),score=35.08 GFYU01000220.1:26-391(+)